MTNIKEIDKKYIAGTYARFPVEIVRGKGSLVYDETDIVKKISSTKINA